MTGRSSRRASLLVALVVAATTAGVGRPAVAVDYLKGEGESWASPAIDPLQRDSADAIAPFQSQFLDNIGEAPARADLAAGAADFAVSSAPLSDADKQTAATNGRSVAYAPYMAGAVAVVVALDVQDGAGGGRIAQLNLKLSTVGKLFTHGIGQWNDPEIISQNPAQQAKLEHLKAPNKVVVVARRDSTSSTAALISLFLSDPDARPIWNAFATQKGSPPDTALEEWPNDSDALVVTNGSKGVVDKILNLDPVTGQKIRQADSSHISYLAPSWAIPNSAPMVTLTSSDGVIRIDPTPDAVNKAVAKATFDPTTNLVTGLPTKITADGAYPASLVSYLAVPTSGLPQDKATALAAFVKFAVSDKGQQDVADVNYVPLSADLRTKSAAVGDAVAAGPASASTTTTTSTVSTTTSTSSTSTSSTSSTTSTTLAAVLAASTTSGSTSGGGSITGAAASPSPSTPAASTTPASTPASSVSSSSDSGLAATGAAARRLALIAACLVLGGETFRRRTRRRLV